MPRRSATRAAARVALGDEVGEVGDVRARRAGVCDAGDLDRCAADCPRVPVFTKFAALDVSAELAHPVLKKATAVAKRNSELMGYTRSTPYSAGWNGEWRHPAPGGWDSLPPAMLRLRPRVF